MSKVMLLAGVGMLYRETLMDTFPAVGEGVRSLGDRLRGRQRGSLYQACPQHACMQCRLSWDPGPGKV